MFNFLSFDSPCASSIYKLANMILLSMMWVFFCIPIFTAGASTTALYYAVQKSIKNDRGNSWTCFWQSFKKNFKSSTLITLIFLAIAVVFFMDIAIIRTMEDEGLSRGYMTVVFILLFILMAIYAFWIYSYIARFEGTVKEYLKNAFILFFMHFPFTVVVTLIGVGSVLLIYLIWPLIFVMPSISIWFMGIFTERVFRRYMSEEDKDLEDELNMNYWNGYVGKRKELRQARKETEKAAAAARAARIAKPAAGAEGAAKSAKPAPASRTQKTQNTQNARNVGNRQSGGSGDGGESRGNVGWKRRG